MAKDPTLDLIHTGIVPGCWPGDQLAKEGLESANPPGTTTTEVLANSPRPEIVLPDGRTCTLGQEEPAQD